MPPLGVPPLDDFRARPPKGGTPNLLRRWSWLLILTFLAAEFAQSTTAGSAKPLYTYTLVQDGTRQRYDEAMAVACLQGIINRKTPELYVLSPTNTRPASIRMRVGAVIPMSFATSRSFLAPRFFLTMAPNVLSAYFGGILCETFWETEVDLRNTICYL